MEREKADVGLCAMCALRLNGYELDIDRYVLMYQGIADTYSCRTNELPQNKRFRIASDVVENNSGCGRKTERPSRPLPPNLSLSSLFLFHSLPSMPFLCHQPYNDM